MSNFDICWMDCPENGERLVSGGSEIFLCEDHMLELKSSSAGGFSKALPPKNSRADKWPWRRLVRQRV